jgi:hypothetical protein
MPEKKAPSPALAFIKPTEDDSEGGYPTVKLHRMPAQIAEPITPEELHAMACISR